MLRGEGWEEQRNEKQTKYKKKKNWFSHILFPVSFSSQQGANTGDTGENVK